MRFAHCARSSAYYCGFVSYRGWKSTPSALNCGTVLRRMSNENEMRHQDGVLWHHFYYTNSTYSIFTCQPDGHLMVNQVS